MLKIINTKNSYNRRSWSTVGITMPTRVEWKKIWLRIRWFRFQPKASSAKLGVQDLLSTTNGDWLKNLTLVQHTKCITIKKACYYCKISTGHQQRRPWYHDALRYCLTKMGGVTSVVSRFYYENIKTAEHIVCDCIALLQPANIKAIGPKEILNFFKS